MDGWGMYMTQGVFPMVFPGDRDCRAKRKRRRAVVSLPLSEEFASLVAKIRRADLSAMAVALDALESDAGLQERATAFNVLQARFDGVGEEHYSRAEALRELDRQAKREAR